MRSTSASPASISTPASRYVTPEGLFMLSQVTDLYGRTVRYCALSPRTLGPPALWYCTGRSAPTSSRRSLRNPDMPNSASTPPSGAFRVRHRLTTCLGILIVLLAPASAAWAGRLVRLYDVQVKGEASLPVVQDALRRVLVRATGRREAASHPA